ncbi:hypothetical protein [Janthinobacterium sp. MDB2-8]|uniref:hypothetical protein n=1 Tax=Janthinobacterium sp. MDB2-8 TaxID=1259338 RepID=UPI003F202741
MSFSIASAVPGPREYPESTPIHSEIRGKPPGIGVARSVTQGNSDVTIEVSDVSIMFQLFHMKHHIETCNRLWI